MESCGTGCKSYDNQQYYARYYNGYGEGMLDYDKFHSQLRVGPLIQTKFFSDF